MKQLQLVTETEKIVPIVPTVPFVTMLRAFEVSRYLTKGETPTFRGHREHDLIG